MSIPDFVGERLDIVLDIIKKQYPDLEYEIINNSSPRGGQKTEIFYGIKRVVRQKLKNKKLELIVFSFKEKPDGI